MYCVFITLYREKQQVHQDLLVKQELLVKGREEVKSLHGDLQETQREREQLERQKQEVQAQLEEIENQVTRGCGQLGSTCGCGQYWKWVVALSFVLFL